MKLSIYTFVKNGIDLDFHLVAMLRHHIPFADEIIVAEGFSTDSTYEQIRNLDPKIKVIRSRWNAQDNILPFKDAARQACTGDWCVLLDCDEFIPEWEWDRMRQFLETTDKHVVPMRFHHFYANYKVRHANPLKVRWPIQNDRIHRNLREIEIWGDGANIRLAGAVDRSHCAEELFDVHHFGMVRNPARLREKWHTQATRDRRHGGKTYQTGSRLRIPIPRLLFTMLPYNWFGKDYINDMEAYEGPYCKAVVDNPTEFVRDGMKVYNHVLRAGRVAPQRSPALMSD